MAINVSSEMLRVVILVLINVLNKTLQNQDWT